MSDYHVLRMQKQDRAQIAFHIPVPSENNDANPAVDLRVCISEYIAETPTKTIVPWLQTDFTAEYAQISGGEVWEEVKEIQFDANLSDVQKRNRMDARFTNLSTAVVNRLRNNFKFWHYNRDVP